MRKSYLVDLIDGLWTMGKGRPLIIVYVHRFKSKLVFGNKIAKI